MAHDKAKIRTELEQQLAAVTAELKTIGIHNPQVKEDWIATPDNELLNEPDPNDVADRVEDWDERQATLAQLETRYNNLNRALTKLDTDGFGVCEICEAEIEPDRLEANLAARTCKAHMNDESTLTT